VPEQLTPVRRALIYANQARSLLAPRERLLPGLGARLQGRPELLSTLLAALRTVPPGRLRAAVFRNVSRPLISRQSVSLKVPVAGGSHMLVETGDLIGRVLAVSGVWEPQVTAAFKTILAPGDVCVDVGANIGYFALLASRLVGSAGHVYALEPSPEIHVALTSNLELNGAMNVTALAVAAGDKDGEAEFYEAHGRNRGASSIRREHTEEDGEVGHRPTRVQVRRLDSVVQHAHLARLKLVKIDVEGYELEVMQGLEPLLLRGARPSVVVELTPAWSGEGSSDYVGEFCIRHRMNAYRLSREKLFSGRGVTRFRPVQIGWSESPQEELLLAPEETSVTSR
jgi:FkbM family methyltransferase